MSTASFRVPNIPARLVTVIVFFVLLLDQLTKWLILKAFVPGESLPLIPSILHLTYVQNTGAAFGLFKDMTLIFIILSLAVSAWILWELCRKGPHEMMRLWGFALVLAGAWGNLIDRVRLGYVVDMIDLRVWPVFNVADSAISVGVGLLLLCTLHTQQPVSVSKTGSRESNRAD